MIMVGIMMGMGLMMPMMMMTTEMLCPMIRILMIIIPIPMVMEF